MVVKLVALVLPLGLDTIAVAAALGSIGISSGRRVRISLTFTAFEAGMPIIGLGLGAPLGHAIGGTADYIAIGVLLAFGLYTLLASEQREEHRLAQFADCPGSVRSSSASASASTSSRSASRSVCCAFQWDSSSRSSPCRLSSSPNWGYG